MICLRFDMGREVWSEPDGRVRPREAAGSIVCVNNAKNKPLVVLNVVAPVKSLFFVLFTQLRKKLQVGPAYFFL